MTKNKYDNKTKDKKLNKVSAVILFLTSFIILLFLTVSFKNYDWFDHKLKHFLLNSFDIVCQDNSLKVHYINVGQADCIAINLPDGKVAVIDTGENTNASKQTIIKYLNNKVLNNKYKKVIDYLILTHSHSDHIGGTAKLLEKYEVKNIYRPHIYSDTETEYDTDGKAVVSTKVYKDTIEAIRKEVNQGAKLFFIEDQMQIECKNAIFKFYGPMTYPSASAVNNYSPIIKFKYQSTTYLFTGDIEKSAEKQILQQYAAELDADVLKVAHHGSITSTCIEFLQAVSVDYAIISVGIDNSNGHPGDTTLQNLQNYGVADDKIYRTDMQGNVLFITGGAFDNAIIYGEYFMIFNLSWWMIGVGFVLIEGFVIFLIIKKFKKHKLN